jgi:hypothetical protein
LSACHTAVATSSMSFNSPTIAAMPFAFASQPELIVLKLENYDH